MWVRLAGGKKQASCGAHARTPRMHHFAIDMHYKFKLLVARHLAALERPDLRAVCSSGHLNSTALSGSELRAVS